MNKVRVTLSLIGLVQFGSSLLLKEAVAAEITAYLGCGFCKHLKAGEEFKGHRNGSRETTIDTPISQVVYDCQLLVNAPGFTSKFHTPYMRRSEAFANAVADMHVNGVSIRNVKRALKSVATEKVRLSKSAVSRITKRLRNEFGEWKKRDLSKLPVVYLFLDAIRIHMRLESTDKAWGTFVYDLKQPWVKGPAARRF